MPPSRLPASLHALAQRLRSSQCSSHSLAAAAIDAAKTSPHGCFSDICEDAAYHAAAAADQRFAAGAALSRLDGVPFAIKDNFCTEFGRTTASSRVLSNFQPCYNATAVQRLLEAGAVPVGKTVMDEFGMGSFTLNREGPRCTNPRDATKVAGGSSGGSAAAVADAVVCVALGSDTGGSIRLPAAYCQVVGFKPSYGSVSRHGLIAYASSLDCPAVVGTCVDDVAAVYAVFSGADGRDAVCSQPRITVDRVLQSTAAYSLAGVRVGIPHECHVEGMSDAALSSWRDAAAALAAAGATLSDVSIPAIEASLAAYYVIVSAEASSNLARYDGARQCNHESLKIEQLAMAGLDRAHSSTAFRSASFGAEVQRRILAGTFVLSNKQYSSVFTKAQQLRSLLCKQVHAAFSQCDAMLLPTSVGPPPDIAGASSAGVQGFCNDVMTVPWSLVGAPAISLPFAGGSNTAGALSMQLVGARGSDVKLLQVAAAAERAFAEWFGGWSH